MNNITILRRIDDLGRVVIPKDARRQLGIQEGDELEVVVRGGEVVMRPVNGSSDQAIVEAAKQWYDAKAAYRQHAFSAYGCTICREGRTLCPDGVQLRHLLNEAELSLFRVMDGEAS